MSAKPIFLPLKREYYDAFVKGDKDTEYRLYGLRWNERTCTPGRPVLLSRGYGKQYRTWGQVVGFERRMMNTPEWLDCYGKRGEAACIKIRLATREAE